MTSVFTLEKQAHRSADNLLQQRAEIARDAQATTTAFGRVLTRPTTLGAAFSVGFIMGWKKPATRQLDLFDDTPSTKPPRCEKSTSAQLADRLFKDLLPVVAGIVINRLSANSEQEQGTP